MNYHSNPTRSKTNRTKKYRRWNKEIIERELLMIPLIQGGLDDKSVRTHSLKLFSACVRFHGSVRSAVESAGIEYLKHVQTYRKWTPNIVLREFKSYEEQGVLIEAPSIRKIDLALHAAAVREFGSFKDARFVYEQKKHTI